jgi:hypothetical protein
MRRVIRKAIWWFVGIYLFCGLLTWVNDVYDEYRYHRDDYTVIRPDGSQYFWKTQFVTQMIDHSVWCIILWPPIMYLQVSLEMGWVPYSSEIKG